MKYTYKKKRNGIKTAKKNTNKSANKKSYKKGGISLFGYQYNTGIGDKYRGWRERVNAEKQTRKKAALDDKVRTSVSTEFTADNIQSNHKWLPEYTDKFMDVNKHFYDAGNEYCYNSVGINRDKIRKRPEYKTFGKEYCDNLFQVKGIFNYKKVIENIKDYVNAFIIQTQPSTQEVNIKSPRDSTNRGEEKEEIRRQAEEYVEARFRLIRERERQEAENKRNQVSGKIKDFEFYLFNLLSYDMPDYLIQEIRQEVEELSNFLELNHFERINFDSILHDVVKKQEEIRQQELQENIESMKKTARNYYPNTVHQYGLTAWKDQNINVMDQGASHYLTFKSEKKEADQFEEELNKQYLQQTERAAEAVEKEKYKKSITEKDKQLITQKARDNFPNIVSEKSLVARMDENSDVTIWYSYKGNLNILDTIVGK